MSQEEAPRAQSITPENQLATDERALSVSPKPSTLPVSSRRKLQRRNIIARAALVLIFLFGFFFSVLPVGRAATRALFTLPALILASQPGVLSAAEEPVQHIHKTIQSNSGPVYLDVYEPTSPPPPVPGFREGMVVIPGVGDSRADPQLINFSQALARAGVVVMDITTPTLINYDLSSNDSDAVVQAFKALSHWPGVGANRVGIIGLSASDALACFAAADPRIRDSVAFITLFGGYFNARTLLQAVGRRALDVDGHMQPWQPQYVPIQVLSNVIAPLLPPTERYRLVNALTPGGIPFTPADLAGLSPDTVAVYHLLAGDEPGQVNRNLAALSSPIQALLKDLSPSRVINSIHAPIYLLHDRNDQFVPFTESRAFAAALIGIHHPHDFAEFGIFQHVEVRSNLNVWQLAGDSTSLFRILTETMRPGS
jgi:dienelactone hydrolase